MYKLQRNQSLGEQVKEEIVKLIVVGKIKPGDRLKEVEIAEKMGISRVPVREALLMLEKEGFIESGLHKNNMVVPIDREELVRVVLPIRLTIECYALEKFIQLAQDEHFEYLSYQISNMQWAQQSGNMEAFVEADIRFHEFLLETSRMRSLLSVWSGISNRIRMLFFSETRIKQERLAEVVQEHRDLLQLFRERNLEAALRQLEQHISELVV